MAQLKSGGQRSIDSFMYVLGCIVTLGSLWIFRIVITKGILFAMEQHHSNVGESSKTIYEQYNQPKAE